MDKETCESMEAMFRQGTTEHRHNFLRMYIEKQNELRQKMNILKRVIYELDGSGSET